MEIATALERWAAVCPPCHLCQKPAMDLGDYSNEEAAAQMATRDRLEEHHPAMVAMIDRFHYLCEACLATREGKKKADNFKARVRKLRERLVRDHLLTFATISAGFEMSNSDIEKANPALWEWARKWTPKQAGAWIYGEEGVGKSYLARCIVMAHVHHGRTAGEVSAIRLVQRAGSWEWGKEHNVLSQLDLLLVEDMDKAQWTMKGLEALWALMDVRFNRGIRTLVTSNGDPEFMSSEWAVIAQSNRSLTPTLMARFLPMERYKMEGRSLRKQFFTQDGKHGEATHHTQGPQSHIPGTS